MKGEANPGISIGQEKLGRFYGIPLFTANMNREKILFGSISPKVGLLITDIDLIAILENPYNSRKLSGSADIIQLEVSMDKFGQLVPIRVRESKNYTGKYELIFGHRRLTVARKLGWKTIRAEIASSSDENLAMHSLLENLSRSDLSDYEKGIAFDMLRRQFNKTYEELSASTGLSRSHICNYVRMIHLFDDAILEQNQSIRNYLGKISEHHARLLLTIEDDNTRLRILKFIVENLLSVNDLQRMIVRLRSWFVSTSGLQEGRQEFVLEEVDQQSRKLVRERSNDASRALEVRNVVISDFEKWKEGDLDESTSLRAYENGYSVFSGYPPLQLFVGNKALTKDHDVFRILAPNFSYKLRDLRVRIFNDTALATFYVDYEDTAEDVSTRLRSRATVVLTDVSGSWKIIHEHYSWMEKLHRTNSLFARANNPNHTDPQN